eukprot:scpid95702/ scgid28584/ 
MKHQQYAKFDQLKDRLDSLLWTDMAQNPRFSRLWPVVSKVLSLSHGQAGVERGFSVNREVEADNLSEAGFVARRLVCDHVQAAGGIDKVDVSSPEILVAVGSARTAYRRHLEREASERAQTQSGPVVDKATKKKEAVGSLQEQITALLKSADDLAKKAEDEKSINFLIQSNSLRSTAAAKQQEVNSLKERLNVLEARKKK